MQIMMALQSLCKIFGKDIPNDEFLDEQRGGELKNKAERVIEKMVKLASLSITISVRVDGIVMYNRGGDGGVGSSRTTGNVGSSACGKEALRQGAVRSGCCIEDTYLGTRYLRYYWEERNSSCWLT
jgi:hypothetical protein